MTAAERRQVTLVRAWEPGAEGTEGERIEFAAALDAQGMPDAQAWLADPSPWPATWHRADGAVQAGDVAHDEEGWQLRFFGAAGAQPDLPLYRLLHLEGGLRPGEVLTLRDPEARDSAWRVVGLG